MFAFTTPEASEATHEQFVGIEEKLFQGLGIPYRVVNIAAGDLGAPAAQKFDCEAWMPGQQQYREVTSCSNCTDYQARRLNCRIRTEQGPRFVFTLNGTGLVILQALRAGKTRAEALKLVEAEYETEGHDAGADVDEFVLQLERHDIVARDPEGGQS